VGKEGVKPDLAKLMAVTDWQISQTLHNLMQFLGLTGYFRPTMPKLGSGKQVVRSR
ncbi:hypothetical protein BDR06DRAFT_896592, partial [Suillus hirtellus]